MSALHTLLNVNDESTLIFTQMQWVNWGRSLVFTVKADDAVFELRFDDCREMRWRIYAHENEDAVQTATPVVDFAQGRDLHRSPSHILTGHFGLSLFYGAVVVLPIPTDKNP